MALRLAAGGTLRIGSGDTLTLVGQAKTMTAPGSNPNGSGISAASPNTPRRPRSAASW